MRKKFIIIALFVSGLFLLSAGGSTGSPAAWVAPVSAKKLNNPLKSNKTVLADAAKIFKTQCVTCHGEKGLGDGPASPYLGTKVANLTSAQVQGQTDGEIYWKISEGKTPMPSFKTLLKDEDRWKMVIFVKNLKH